MSLFTWWYRVSGQQQRDEAAAIRAMANRYNTAALSLMPEILHLIEQVGIERAPSPIYGAAECTPVRWRTMTERQWRKATNSPDCWGMTAIQLSHAQEHAATAFDFAESAINYAERATVELNRAYCPRDNLHYASDSVAAARDLALAAHRHLLEGQAAYGQYERLHAAELASADELPTPARPVVQPAPVAAPVEQPIAVPDWPVPVQYR